MDPELKDCFKDLVATPNDIFNYFNDLIKKHALDLNQVNQAGHVFNG